MTDIPTIKAESVLGFLVAGDKCTLHLGDDAGRPVAIVELTFDAAKDLIRQINLRNLMQGHIVPTPTPQKAH